MGGGRQSRFSLLIGIKSQPVGFGGSYDLRMRQRLRYKDYRLLRLEAVTEGQLGITPGNVHEFDSMKDLSTYLEECNILPWWTEHMGFNQGGK